MKDRRGIELNIGDNVVYIHGKNTDAHLETGTITKFYPGPSGRGEECSVGSATHIKRARIMKIMSATLPKKTEV